MHCSTSSKAKWVVNITCLSLFNDMLMVWGQTLSSDKVPRAFCLQIFMLHKCWFDTLSPELSLLKQLNLCSMVCSAIAFGDCDNYLAFVPILANAARFSKCLTPTSHIVLKSYSIIFLYLYFLTSQRLKWTRICTRIIAATVLDSDTKIYLSRQETC